MHWSSKGWKFGHVRIKDHLMSTDTTSIITSCNLTHISVCLCYACRWCCIQEEGSGWGRGLHCNLFILPGQLGYGFLGQVATAWQIPFQHLCPFQSCEILSYGANCWRREEEKKSPASNFVILACEDWVAVCIKIGAGSEGRGWRSPEYIHVKRCREWELVFGPVWH